VIAASTRLRRLVHLAKETDDTYADTAVDRSCERRLRGVLLELATSAPGRRAAVLRAAWLCATGGDVPSPAEGDQSEALRAWSAIDRDLRAQLRITLARIVVPTEVDARLRAFAFQMLVQLELFEALAICPLPARKRIPRGAR
jgi:hypothetical protein